MSLNMFDGIHQILDKEFDRFLDCQICGPPVKIFFTCSSSFILNDSLFSNRERSDNPDLYLIILFKCCVFLERVKGALVEIGGPVTSGGFSTFLAFVLLAASKSYVFTTFFKVKFVFSSVNSFLVCIHYFCKFIVNK